MTHIVNGNSEPAKMQADVVSRRDEGRLSRLVSEFRIVVLVGIVVAVAASLLFAQIPAVVSIAVGAIVGAVLAVFARVSHLI